MTAFRLPVVLVFSISAFVGLVFSSEVIIKSPEKLPSSLPLFQPHRKSFPCVSEAQVLPPIDAQADSWFREARALEDPSIFSDDRDYLKIIDLTSRAARRRHWLAMLNLASFYMEGKVPDRGAKDAVLLVDLAMRMGVPAAYDRMGTYYMNGDGVGQDATKAFAFWQRAAELGNLQAQAFLGEKLNSGADEGGYWSNIPISIKMLECAFSQGYGEAAYTLAFLYDAQRSADGTIIASSTSKEKSRALWVLHQGAKLGCSECADRLSVEFDSPIDFSEALAPAIDKARAERYGVVGEVLRANRNRLLPKLDRIIPLPPAVIPTWDGTRESLLAAGMGVTFASGAAASESDDAYAHTRFALDPAYALKKTNERTDAVQAPFEGYWQPMVEGIPGALSGQIKLPRPGLYRTGEPFDVLPLGRTQGGSPRVVWQHFITVRHGDPNMADPQAVAGRTRVVPRPKVPTISKASDACPASGIWQPWLRADHPLQSIVNQTWRQAWCVKGQQFPDPKRDWLLDLPASEINWHLMERAEGN